MSLIDGITEEPGLDGALQEKQRDLLNLRRHGVLTGLLLFGFVGAVATVGLMLVNANRSAAQVHAIDRAVMYSQRMAKAASTVVLGNRAACAELQDSVVALGGVVANLRKGGDGALAIAPAAVQPTLDSLWPLVERAERNANVLQDQQKALIHVDQALRAISSQSDDLLEGAEAVSAQALLDGAQPNEVSAVGQLVMLTQRIGKSANELLSQDGVSPMAVFLLGKDLNSFKHLNEALLNGNADLRVNAVRDPVLRERLQTLLASYEQTRVQGAAILSRLQGMVLAREAQVAILKDAEPLREGLEQAASELEKSGRAGIGTMLSTLVSMMMMLAGTFGFMRQHLRVQEKAASPRLTPQLSA